MSNSNWMPPFDADEYGFYPMRKEEIIKVHNSGIADGLRMTAKTFRDLQWKAFKTGVPIHWFDFYQAILAKAKEVEEAKLEK